MRQSAVVVIVLASLAGSSSASDNTVPPELQRMLRLGEIKGKPILVYAFNPA